MAFVEERRSKLALLVVKLDDAFFDGARRNQPIDRDGASLSDVASLAPQAVSCAPNASHTPTAPDERNTALGDSLR
jgi:hypothetical protein